MNIPERPPGWFVHFWQFAIVAFAWLEFDWRVATLVGAVLAHVVLVRDERPAP